MYIAPIKESKSRHGALSANHQVCVLAIEIMYLN